MVGFSDIMKNTLRETDRFARLGGDEFVVLLFGSDDADAEVFFERLAETSFQIEFDSEFGSELAASGASQDSSVNSESDGTTTTGATLSFSLGWHTWDSNIVTAQNWVDAADEAMYKQKRQYKKYTGAQKVG